jgi:bifunctional DNA-binding transcriptional regulator/antitoxin component of YhaV-PrlF toxin-antitoxin module
MFAAEGQRHMTRIVHENFPVERLPDELRKALGDATHVRLTVEDKAADETELAKLDAVLAAASAEVRAGRGLTAEKVREHIRARRSAGMKRAS